MTYLNDILNNYVNNDLSNIIIDYTNDLNNNILNNEDYIKEKIFYKDKQIIFKKYNEYTILILSLIVFLDIGFLNKNIIGENIIINEKELIKYYIDNNNFIYYKNALNINKMKHKKTNIKIKSNRLKGRINNYIDNLNNNHNLVNCCCNVKNNKDNAFYCYNDKDEYILIGSKCIFRFNNKYLRDYANDSIEKNKNKCLLCYGNNLKYDLVIHKCCEKRNRKNHDFNCFKSFINFNKPLIKKFFNKYYKSISFDELNYNDAKTCKILLKVMKYKLKKKDKYKKQIKRALNFFKMFINVKYGDDLNK